MVFEDAWLFSFAQFDRRLTPHFVAPSSTQFNWANVMPMVAIILILNQLEASSNGLYAL